VVTQSDGRPISEFEASVGRIPIRHVEPGQPELGWIAKAYVGEVIPFGATIFRDGHDELGAELILVDPSGVEQRHRMLLDAPGTDHWTANVLLAQTGEWRYRVRAWTDDWATWLHNAGIKIPAGIDVELVFQIGVQLLGRAKSGAAVRDAIAVLSNRTLAPAARLAAASGAKLAAAIEARPIASTETVGDDYSIRVERARAGVGSWYEFFPRSEGAKKSRDGEWVPGNFRSATRRLPAVAAMGFDVLYLPPIHPIGTSFRKGRNNSLKATQQDPGSPWAIGSAEGGHDAINPALGTVKDFSRFLVAARANRLEVALDLALQCSPDHPWVTEHPEWFSHLPNGSIAYAENPPKKYQDIYPLNFDNDPDGVAAEVLRIVRYWIALGVTIFRVDNPHTKPLRFWEWLLREVAAESPDVVFLAEAFTRPAMMQALAGVGFQQSYTYFTWRNTKEELESYLVELSKKTSAYFRPNLFVNTPDILPEYLQFGGQPAFAIRAAIAATASPSWGIYAGFELYENIARVGSEEYIDNEKYEFRPREFAKAERLGKSLAPYIARLNEIRALHPALRQLRNLDVHWSDDDSILVYSKFLAGSPGDGIIVVVNVDPHSVRETLVHLDETRFGIAAGVPFGVTDLLTEESFIWGTDNYVRLDAFSHPVHILRVDYPRTTRGR
jgi:starch synthase (maltosyl-transferring)